ncbi:MAG: signal peptidase II [Mycoplasmatales bacterium]
MTKYKIKEMALIIVLVGIDQMLKIIIDNTLNLGQIIKIVPSIQLTKLYNYGVSFSFLANKTYLIIAITIIAIIYLFILKKSYMNKYINLGINLVIAGGIGNLIDRLVYNYVIDYIKVDFFNFPIFNLADILVSLGFIIIIIAYLLTKEEKDENHNKK